MIDRSVF